MTCKTRTWGATSVRALAAVLTLAIVVPMAGAALAGFVLAFISLVAAIVRAPYSSGR